MAIKIKESKLSLLLNPPKKQVFLLIDSEDGNNLKVKNSDGICYTIPRVIGGGGSTGDSVIIGSLKTGTPVGAYYLANGIGVAPVGDFCQAAGYYTTASGDYSRSSGGYTTASGNYSFAGGVGQSDKLVIASRVGSFNFSVASGVSSDAAANHSAILGGVNNNISFGADYAMIFGGSSNTVGSNSTFSIMIGCSGATASENNFVYVPRLILTSHSTAVINDPNGAIMYDGTKFRVYTEDSTYDIITTQPSSGYHNTNWDTAATWGEHVGLYKSVSWFPTWSEVSAKPSFATVATTGSYNDLLNKPATTGDMFKSENLAGLTSPILACSNIYTYHKTEVWDITESYHKDEVYAKSETYTKDQCILAFHYKIDNINYIENAAGGTTRTVPWTFDLADQYGNWYDTIIVRHDVTGFIYWTLPDADEGRRITLYSYLGSAVDWVFVNTNTSMPSDVTMTIGSYLNLIFWNSEWNRID